MVMAEQKCSRECRGFVFTLHVPIDAHKYTNRYLDVNHEQDHLSDSPGRISDIRNFQTRLTPYVTSNQQYDLYRKLDALHLYTGKPPKQRLQAGRVRRERKRRLDLETSSGRVSTSEVTRSGAMVRVKYTKIHPRRRTLRLLNSPPTIKSTGGSSLLELPPEIRCQIYEYLLVCGKVFPYSSFDNTKKDDKEANGYTRPTTAITQVSKLIQKESESILYSKNTFVLPSRRWTKAFFDNCLHNQSRRSSIRSVQVQFSCKDAYLSDELIKNLKLRDLCDKLRQEMKAKYPLRSDMVQSLKDEYVRRYREDTIIRRITDIAWLDKANYILDNLKLDDMAVKFISQGIVRDYIFPGNIWPEELVIDAFKAGFVFGIPTRLSFEGFHQMALRRASVYDYARQKMVDWTALRDTGESGNVDLGC